MSAGGREGGGDIPFQSENMIYDLGGVVVFSPFFPPTQICLSNKNVGVERSFPFFFFPFFRFFSLPPPPLHSRRTSSLFSRVIGYRNDPVLNDLGYNNAMKSRPVLGVQLYSNATNLNVFFLLHGIGISSFFDLIQLRILCVYIHGLTLNRRFRFARESVQDSFF